MSVSSSGFIIKSIFLGSLISLSLLLPPAFAVDSTQTTPGSRTGKSARPYLLDQGITGRMPLNGTLTVTSACPGGYEPLVVATLNRSGGWDSQDDGDYIVGWGLNWVSAQTSIYPSASTAGETRINYSGYTWYQDGHGNESWGGLVWQLYCRPV